MGRRYGTAPEQFLLTRLSRGVTRAVQASNFQLLISTHTPLARRDLMEIGDFPGVGISTHTPLARRDSAFRESVSPSFRFLLTRLSRGVTKGCKIRHE